PTPISTLSLHDALPISPDRRYELRYSSLASSPSVRLRHRTIAPPSRFQCVETEAIISSNPIPSFLASTTSPSISFPSNLESDWKDRKSTRLNSSHVEIS